MPRIPPLQAVSAGLLTAFVGFASSFAVVLQGLGAVGADPAQAASGLMALSVAMGLCGVLLSWHYRMPVSIAWSTPGAALLASAGAPEGGFAVAVGAFLVAGLAVPAAAIVAILLIVLGLPDGALSGSLLPAPTLTAPAFQLAGLLGIALPLFLVTMASQNIPGLAVLSVNGYRPEPGPLFAATGLLSLVSAPFGGHAVNLSAITAALCAGPDWRVIAYEDGFEPAPDRFVQRIAAVRTGAASTAADAPPRYPLR